MKYIISVLRFLVVGLSSGCAVGINEVPARKINDNTIIANPGLSDAIKLPDVSCLKDACPGCVLSSELDEPVTVTFLPDVDIVFGKEVNGSQCIECVIIMCVDGCGNVVNAEALANVSLLVNDRILDSLMQWKFKPGTKDNKSVGFVYAAKVLITVK